MILYPENFAQREHWIGRDARNLEQSFVTNPSADPFVFREGPKVKPRDSRSQRLALRIDRNDRLREARDSNAFDSFAVLLLGDHGPDGLTGRVPNGTGFEIRPAWLWMGPRSGFACLGDDVSALIES